MGKSTLGNQLLGGSVAFAQGHSLDLKTEFIFIATGNFLGIGQCFTIIDTPGVRDTRGCIYTCTTLSLYLSYLRSDLIVLVKVMKKYLHLPIQVCWGQTGQGRLD